MAPTCRRPLRASATRPHGAIATVELLGDAFELRYEEGDCPQPGTSAEHVWELFTTAYGPTKALADSLDAERRAALRRDWIAYFDQFRAGVSQPRPYLLALGTRRRPS
jgi:hypothetical protein